MTRFDGFRDKICAKKCTFLSQHAIQLFRRKFFVFFVFEDLRCIIFVSNWFFLQFRVLFPTFVISGFNVTDETNIWDHPLYPRKNFGHIVVPLLYFSVYSVVILQWPIKDVSLIFLLFWSMLDQFITIFWCEYTKWMSTILRSIHS